MDTKRTLAIAILALLVSAGAAIARPWDDGSPGQGQANAPPAPDNGVTTGTADPAMVTHGELMRAQHAPDVANSPQTTPLNDAPPIVQGAGGSPQSPGGAGAAPAPTANFEGLHPTVDCTVPPDSDGAVGPTYWVAFVNNYNDCATQTPSGNVGFYYKSNGTLAAAFYYPSLFSGFTDSGCNSLTVHSDPQVVYDSAKDRYIFVDITTAAPFEFCVAATLSNDPAHGSYCVEEVKPSSLSSLPDYEKAGIWTDGYYVSYNPTGDSHTVVVNTTQLESCTTTSFQDFDMGSVKSGGVQTIFRPDPAGYNINTGIPNAGEPEFIVAGYDTGNVNYVFTLKVNWTNSANSVLTRNSVTVTTWTIGPSTVSSAANPLDTLREHTMVPAPYFKDASGNEYLWTTRTVAGSTTSVTAIAWYQMNVTGGTVQTSGPTNQGIWNPDSTSRLQGAIGIDRNGDILMDYTQVSSTSDPSIRYAGRLVTDPANTMGQSESTLFTSPSMGSGACSTENPCHRWGDYSSNFIDPDGCTFWFTHEYYPGSDPWQWDTRVGATSYSSCTPLNYGRTIGTTSLSWADPVGQDREGPQTVTVTNTGTGPLVLQTVTLTGANATKFSISSDTCSASKVAAGGFCQFNVDCSTSSAGTYAANANVDTNVAAGDLTAVALSCVASTASLGAGSSSPGGYDGGQRGGLDPTPQGNYQ